MINWKKWPNEKPYTSGWYLIAKSNNGVYEYTSMYRMKYHKNDDTWGLCKDFEPEFWAEVNLPYYDPEPFIPFVSGNGGQLVMEKWYLPSKKMPDIGDRIVVQDWSGEEMEIIIKNLPEQPYNGNVCKWRYADE